MNSAQKRQSDKVDSISKVNTTQHQRIHVLWWRILAPHPQQLFGAGRADTVASGPLATSFKSRPAPCTLHSICMPDAEAVRNGGEYTPSQAGRLRHLLNRTTHCAPGARLNVIQFF